VEEYISFIRQLVAQGGPKSEDYPELENKISAIAAIIKQSDNSEHIIKKIRNALGNSLTSKTIQGYGFLKPYGYSGDFFMIDKIYLHHLSPDKNLKNWDAFFHTQKAPIAVRNRKQYFKKLLFKLRNVQSKRSLHVLNVASGPCRDVCEYLDESNDSNIHFFCVEYDPHAIEYAKKVCKDHSGQMTFHNKNAFRFSSDIKFDLIWSSGLFDYFSDKHFIFLIKRLYKLLGEKGELVVGNFHPANPSRDYMEIVGDWYLTYRSEFDLLRLAQQAGFTTDNIRVDAEKENVNLFLHIKKGNRFL